jgi:hypothetical protein
MNARWIVAFAAAVAGLSCRDTSRRDRTQPIASVAPSARQAGVPTIPAVDACFATDTAEATTEADAMRCGQGAIKRRGDTLVIELSGTGVRKRVDVPAEGESYVSYRYAGRIGGSGGTPAFHVVDARGYETEWVELVNAATGDSLVVSAHPALSPDGARFAVDALDFESCEGATTLEVWRITGDVPVREWKTDPYPCDGRRGWGPSNVAWRSPDTITFVQNTVPSDSARRAAGDWDTAPALLVRHAGKWQLDLRPR